ncbi:Hypothetical predicted protein [Podarcis lilfordi]|uniref:Uncharacterized protein n=1 Tax=Podarcis lilfordi TaxID=74358 RepID=A0AA35L6M2_9SAUR|nr:Hypothetical predicted protein [Podarcis lilfordi]
MQGPYSAPHLLVNQILNRNRRHNARIGVANSLFTTQNTPNMGDSELQPIRHPSSIVLHRGAKFFSPDVMSPIQCPPHPLSPPSSSPETVFILWLPFKSDASCLLLFL